MSRRKKVVIGFAAGIAAIIVVFTVVLYFTAEYILNSEWARKQILARITAAVGGELNYKRMDVDFSPRPALTFSGVDLIRPETIAHIDKLLIHPELLPLLKGELNISIIRFERPGVRVILPKEEEAPIEPRIIEQKLIPILRYIAQIAPDLRMELHHGTLSLVRPGGDGKGGTYVFRGINLRLSVEQLLNLNVRCESSPWGPLAFDGRLGYREGMLEATRVNGSLGGNSISEVSARLDWSETLRLKLNAGRSVLDLSEIETLTARRITKAFPTLKTIGGRIAVTSATFEGPLERPDEWRYAGRGSVKDLAIRDKRIPEPILITAADASTDQDGLYLRNAEARAFDSFMKLDGSLRYRNWSIDNLLFSGTIGRKTIRFFSDKTDILNGIVLPSGVALKGGLTSRPGAIEIRNLTLSTGSNFVEGLTGRLDWAKKETYLKAGVNRAALSVGEFGQWGLQWAKRIRPDLESIGGIIALSAGQFEGFLEKPEDWKYLATGTVKNAEVKVKSLPGAIHVADAEFDADQNRFSYQNARAAFLDADAVGSGMIRLSGAKADHTELLFSGKMGNDAVRWVTGLFTVPENVRIPQTLAVTGGRLKWDAADRFSLGGTFKPQGGPRLAFELTRSPGLIKIRDGSVKDALSDANFSLDYANDRTAVFSFSGTLHKKTVDALYPMDQPQDASISGNLRGRIPFSTPRAATAQGTLNARNLYVLLGEKQPIMINSLMLRADQDRFKIESSDLFWMSQKFSLQGMFRASAQIIDMDAEIRTDRIGLDELIATLGATPAGKPPERADQRPFAWVANIPVQGTLRIKADRLVRFGKTLEPFAAEISVGAERIRIFAERALLCGVPVPGTIEIVPAGMVFTIRSEVKNIFIAPILKCLTGERMGITGNVSFRSEIEGTEKIPQSLKGDGELTIRDGRIYRFNLLTRLLEFLNITSVVLGELPEFGKKGMPYDTIRMRYRIEKGKVIISRIQLNGDTVAIAGEGSIDIAKNTMNLTLLVSPLRTIDKILGKIPIVRQFRSIIAIPVSIYGDVSNPVIVPLSPGAVGSHIFDLMKDAIQLPFKIFEPLTK